MLDRILDRAPYANPLLYGLAAWWYAVRRRPPGWKFS